MGTLIDLTGQRFGRLVVLNRDPDRGHGHKQVAYWVCQCDCGAIKSVNSQSLRKGLTQSCGCLSKEITAQNNRKYKTMDLLGKKFGKLTALEKLEKRSGSNVVWKCQCECGGITEVSSVHLTNGDIVSCGCIISKGEELIAQLLTVYNIPFEKQKTFDSCRYPKTNYPARFDFWVNEQYLIEFDGIQHSERINAWYTPEEFLQMQARDEYKNNWAKQNNIPLLRVSYKQLDNLTIDDLILQHEVRREETRI